MQVDELRRELAARIENAPSPTARADDVIRRGTRRIALKRGGAVLTVFFAVALVVGSLVARNGATTRVTTTPGQASGDRWSVHDKEQTGLGAGTSLTAIASTSDSLLVAGARPVGSERSWQATIWYSSDGPSWTQADVPSTAGQVNAIASKGRRAIAAGGSGTTSFVWMSNDRGRHWTSVAEGTDVFGPPAGQMGRPFVSALRAQGNTWIASGGGSDGYEAIWSSSDGREWQEVLGSRSGGSVDIQTLGDGGLLGYWVTTGWRSPDGRSWGSPVSLSVPDRLMLQTVAPGAKVAFGASLDRGDVPTPLLRSSDRGRTWSVDRSFLDAFPDARVFEVTRANGLWIAAGWSGQPNHPDAWITSDLARWTQLPNDLYGAPGGTLGLVGSLKNRIVLLGTAPELDRYYTVSASR